MRRRKQRQMDNSCWTDKYTLVCRSFFGSFYSETPWASLNTLCSAIHIVLCCIGSIVHLKAKTSSRWYKLTELFLVLVFNYNSIISIKILFIIAGGMTCCRCLSCSAASPSLQCTVTWGWMLNSKSSLPRWISNRRGRSPFSASWMSSVVSTGSPFTFTITSPFLNPPLRHRERKSRNHSVEQLD